MIDGRGTIFSQWRLQVVTVVFLQDLVNAPVVVLLKDYALYYIILYYIILYSFQFAEIKWRRPSCSKYGGNLVKRCRSKTQASDRQRDQSNDLHFGALK